MRVTRLKILSLILGVVLPASLFAAEDIRSDLRRCSALADDVARLNCFDALTAGIEKISVANPPDAKPVPPQVDQEVVDAVIVNQVNQVDQVDQVDQGPKSTAVPLDDSVGKEQIESTDSEDKPTYIARLTRCEETGVSKLTVFYLDNGQVWKQRNTGRLRMRDCDADIEINKDWFGFKMYIPSQKRTVRVARIN